MPTTEPNVKIEQVRIGGGTLGRGRADVVRALNEALRAANPRTILGEKVKLKGSELIVDSSIKLDVSRFQRILVIGGGKAGAGMAAAIEQILGKRITAGRVNVPDYLESRPRLDRIEFHEATHPVPSVKGMAGVCKMLDLVGQPSNKDLIICLISGGGSALMPMPIESIKLDDEKQVTNLLLRSGARIQEMNTVRKHLSATKGGRLAEKLYPATVLSLIISDVVGDELDSIASGPTVPDSTTYQDTKEILMKYKLWDELSKSVRNTVDRGVSDHSYETPKPGSRIFKQVFNVLVGSSKQSCVAAAGSLKKSGYKTLILSTHIQGEARDVGQIFAGILSDVRRNGIPLRAPAAIVAGGESTVTITGHGKGGRNQELVLSAAFGIESVPDVVVASMGTDGVDGPTDAAGAIADSSTLSRAKMQEMDPKNFLQEHNSYNFFRKLGDLIITGPTGTNVNDIMILVAPRNRLVRRKSA
ncbi:MAG: glycerate kinase type-2 family protein [Nitrososphaerales archaeon]